jgi:hypothetical protein
LGIPAATLTVSGEITILVKLGMLERYRGNGRSATIRSR